MSSKIEEAEEEDRTQLELPESLDQDRLREIMIYRALGYNQTEVADRVGVSQKTVSKYLNEVNDLAERSSSAKAVFYNLLIEMFTDKLQDGLAFLFEITEDLDDEDTDDE